MRTSIVVAAVAVLAVAGGGAYYGLEVYPQREFRAGLDQALTTLPPGTTMTYKDAHYAPVTGLATLTGVTVHGIVPTDPPQPFDVTVDTIETTRPNLDFAVAWAKAATTPMAPDAALPVAEGIFLKGVTYKSAAFNGTQEFLRVARPRVYPWALLHEGMPSWKQIQTAMTRLPDNPAPADLQPLLRAEAAVMAGVAYDNYELGASKGSQTMPGVNVAWSIRKLSGSGLDRGVLAGASAEGVSVTVTGDQAGSFSVDRVGIGATDVRDPMTRLVNGETPSPALLTGIKIGRIDYVGITAQPPGMPATRIGGISLGPVAFSNGIPVVAEFGWTDVTVTAAQMPDPDSREMFEKLGLKTLTVSFSAAYDWDVVQQKASLRGTMLKVNELGTLTLAADFVGIPPNLTTLEQARLARAKLRFEDASLADRLLRMGAAQSGADPAAFRQQIAGMVLAQTAAFGAGSPVILAAGKSAGEFIAAPRSLTIELSPAAPVPLRTLESKADDPGGLASMLGLTVIANKP